MMGSGKSTVGRLLADATGWPYADNDDLVLREHGATPRDLVATRSEAVMRRAESDALGAALRLPAPVIVGAAAGVILDADDREALRSGGVVVWLRAAAHTLARRAVGAAHRPWLDGDAEAWMTAALLEREPLYAAIADRVVDTESGSAVEAAADLRAWLLAETSCESVRSGERP